MTRWHGTLLLAAVFTARSCYGNDSNRTEVLNIGDTFGLTEKTVVCHKDNNQVVVLPMEIKSPNNGGFYQCFITNETLEDIIVIIRHEVSSVNASGDRCADESSSNSTMCLTIEEGESKTLWCNATDGYPPPAVKWFIREIDKKYKNGYKDTDLGIEGQLLIRNISYDCNSPLVCKVGNYINKDKKSMVEKLIMVYVGRKPDVTITKDGKRLPQNNFANISICPMNATVFSCYTNNRPPPDVIRWNINDIHFLTWTSTWNSTWISPDYFELSSSLSIPCKLNFDSIIRPQKVTNLPNITIEWKNINLECVSYIKCEADNKVGKDIKTLYLMTGKCPDSDMTSH